MTFCTFMPWKHKNPLCSANLIFQVDLQIYKSEVSIEKTLNSAPPQKGLKCQHFGLCIFLCPNNHHKTDIHSSWKHNNTVFFCLFCESTLNSALEMLYVIKSKFVLFALVHMLKIGTLPKTTLATALDIKQQQINSKSC